MKGWASCFHVFTLFWVEVLIKFQCCENVFLESEKVVPAIPAARVGTVEARVAG